MQCFREDLLGAKETYRKLLEASDSELLRFLAEAEHVVDTSPKDRLLKADRTSLLVALGESAASRLSISPTMGEAYLIPRKGKVDFQSGYKGLVKLAYRSGMIDSLHVDVVYDGEAYTRTGGTSPGIDHTPDDSKRTGKLDDIVGAYAVFWLVGSSRPMFRAITRATIIKAAEASGNPFDKSYSDVWRSHPEAMAWKTALIRCANQLPRSDKFRAFHMASSRAVLREANVELPAIAGLEDLAPTALPPAEPPKPKPGAGLNGSISRRISEVAEAAGKPESEIRLTAFARCHVPAVDTDMGPVAPTIEQLSFAQKKAVREWLIRAAAKLEVRAKDDHQITDADFTEREPGDDRSIDDEEPPADWKPRDPRAGAEDRGDGVDHANADYHAGAGDR
jgi:phage RecT family recombinase